jgi:hypothetical protein
MSFNVSSLTNYINEQSTELIGRSFFESRSAGYFGGLQAGVKTSDALQLLAVTAVPQADSSCAFNASGSTTFTQRNITVGNIKYQDTLCPKDLRAKWTQILLRRGANAENEELTFANQIADLLVNLIHEHIEVMDWQGDTTSGSEYLNKYDGLIKIIDAASGVVAGNTGSVTSFTSSNAIAVVNAMCDAAPAKIKTSSDKVLFMGTDQFDIYVNALMAANLFHTNATSYADYELSVPGKNVRVIGVHGLDSTNRMFLGRTPNFYLGTDLVSDMEEFEMWYSKDDRNIKYNVAFKRGVQVAYPDEIVQFTLA